MKNNEKLVYIGIGCILGWFSSHILVSYYGMGVLWGLSIFGVVVFVLGFMHVYSVNSGHKKRLQENSKESEGESKTLRNRLRIWSK